MKYCKYTAKDADGNATTGVCHKSRLEYLATPGASVAFEMISDDEYAKTVASWNGAEISPAASAKKRAVA